MGLSPYALQQAQSTRSNPSSVFTQQAHDSLTQGQRPQAPGLPITTPAAPQRPVSRSPIVEPNQRFPQTPSAPQRPISRSPIVDPNQRFPQTPSAPQRPVSSGSSGLPIVDPNLRFPQTPSAPQRPVAPSSSSSSSSSSTTTTRSPRQTQFGTRERVSEIQGATLQARADAERLQRARADYKATAIIRNGLVWRKEHNGAPITAAIGSQIRTAVDQADVDIYNGQILQRDTTAQIADVFEDVTDNYRRQIPQLASEVQQIIQQQQSVSVASQSETTAEVHIPTAPRTKVQKTERGIRKVNVEIDDDSQQNADLPPFRRGTIPFVPSSETPSSFNFRKPLFSPAARDISVVQPESESSRLLNDLSAAKDQLNTALNNITFYIGHADRDLSAARTKINSSITDIVILVKNKSR